MKKVKYVQCGFRRKTETGYEHHVAWIPQQFAQKGRILDFGKNRESKGWEVETVTKETRDGKDIEEKSRVKFGSIS